MLGIIIAIFLVVTIMLLLMMLMLKKLIKTLNDKTKTSFVNKLQEYDNLIEIKSKQLEEINKKIKTQQNMKIANKDKSLNIEDQPFYEISSPSYKDEDLFKKYKQINEKFDINNRSIINKFIEENIDNFNDKFYQQLIKINKKLQFDDIYELLLLDENEQIKLLKQTLDKEEQDLFDNYSKQSFNILEFKSYIEDLICKEDPTIYIKVGNVQESYDYLNDLIKTSYDESICKGIMIIYKNKLYDYSLS